MFYLCLSEQGDVYLQGEIQDLQQSVSIPDGSLQGEVQILHATPEQISQLQQAHHIQILQGDHIIQVPVPVNVSLTGFCVDNAKQKCAEKWRPDETMVSDKSLFGKELLIFFLILHENICYGTH